MGAIWVHLQKLNQQTNNFMRAIHQTSGKGISLTEITSILFFFLVFSIPFQANSQTAVNHKAKISEHHQKAMIKAEMLQNEKAPSKVDEENAVSDIGEHLRAANEHHVALQKEMPGNKAVHSAITKHHEEAIASHKELVKEVGKPKPNESVIHKLASKLHKSIKSAEAEVKKL
jgi:hypothetical protein